MDVLPNIARLSLNQITTQRWGVREAVAGCVRAGIPAIGLWRDKVAETGVAESRRIVRDAGLQVSSLCRGGWFLAATERERSQRFDDNRRAIEEAAQLGTEVLVLVCGPAPDRDIVTARAMVAEAIARLVPYAVEHQVKLAIEPLHPMFAADRSVIVTLDEANSIAEQINSPYVGVAIDVYHVWWDPQIYAQIERAAGRILGFHVNDWLVPLPDVLMGRGMMGDGVVELRRLRQAVDRAGYTGFIEVEIFNQAIWHRPGDEVLHQMCERFLRYV
ncbi:MAG TPA: sugar phosphate isomerase/epimerase family protein [Ktedonobacteraceae bacterium]|nr:sugar phosphate isomerase/epimerase family protein [Ktedonobacteraceae bacterium]